MKRLISATVIFTLVLSSFIYAEGVIMIPGKSGSYNYNNSKEILRPGVDGPIYSETDPQSTTTTPTIVENTVTDTTQEESRSRLEELQLRLAQLRGEVPAEESKTVAPLLVINNIESGYNSEGVAYGFARLAQNLSAKRGQVNFESATYIKDNRYEVTNSSKDAYANGTFIVDVFDATENELKEGYQIWFSLYDSNFRKIGTAQAFRK